MQPGDMQWSAEEYLKKLDQNAIQIKQRLDEATKILEAELDEKLKEDDLLEDMEEKVMSREQKIYEAQELVGGVSRAKTYKGLRMMAEEAEAKE